MRSGVFDVVVVGGINSDFVVRGESLPKPGESVLCSTFFEGPGGKGANQAVAAARLGARVAIIGCVGDDERGDSVLKNLRREGVCTDWVARTTAAPTGVALILVDAQGEKSIGACLGANLKLAPRQIVAAARVLASTKVLLMQFEAPDEALLAAAQRARKAGAFVILDPAPPRKIPAKLWPHLDIIRPNAAEAEFLTGVRVKDAATARQAARVLIKKGPTAVALQAGEEGDLLVWANGELLVPRFKVKSVDATGAGDAFAAGLAVGLAEGRLFPEAGRRAGAVAALSTTKLGAQAGLPTRLMVDRFLKNARGG